MYQPTISELSDAAAADRQRRRHLRLQQVREQSRLSSLRLRQRSQAEWALQRQQLKQEVVSDWAADKENRLCALETEYSACLRHVGSAHRAAERLRSGQRLLEARDVQLREQRCVATRERYKTASTSVQQQREASQLALLKQKERRLLVADRERLRSQCASRRGYQHLQGKKQQQQRADITAPASTHPADISLMTAFRQPISFRRHYVSSADELADSRHLLVSSSTSGGQLDGALHVPLYRTRMSAVTGGGSHVRCDSASEGQYDARAAAAIHTERVQADELLAAVRKQQLVSSQSERGRRAGVEESERRQWDRVVDELNRAEKEGRKQAAAEWAEESDGGLVEQARSHGAVSMDDSDGVVVELHPVRDEPDRLSHSTVKPPFHPAPGRQIDGTSVVTTSEDSLTELRRVTSKRLAIARRAKYPAERPYSDVSAVESASQSGLHSTAGSEMMAAQGPSGSIRGLMNGAVRASVGERSVRADGTPLLTLSDHRTSLSRNQQITGSQDQVNGEVSTLHSSAISTPGSSLQSKLLSVNGRSLEASSLGSRDSSYIGSNGLSSMRSQELSDVRSHEASSMRSLDLSLAGSNGLSSMRSEDLSDTRTPDCSSMRSQDLSDARSHEASSMRSQELSDARTPECSSMRSQDLSDMRSHEALSMRSQELSGTRTPECSSIRSQDLSDVRTHEVSSMRSREFSDVRTLEGSSMRSHEFSNVISREASNIRSQDISYQKSREPLASSTGEFQIHGSQTAASPRHQDVSGHHSATSFEMRPSKINESLRHERQGSNHSSNSDPHFHGQISPLHSSELTSTILSQLSSLRSSELLSSRSASSNDTSHADRTSSLFSSALSSNDRVASVDSGVTQYRRLPGESHTPTMYSPPSRQLGSATSLLRDQEVATDRSDTVSCLRDSQISSVECTAKRSRSEVTRLTARDENTDDSTGISSMHDSQLSSIRSREAEAMDDRVVSAVGQLSLLSEPWSETSCHQPEPLIDARLQHVLSQLAALQHRRDQLLSQLPEQLQLAGSSTAAADSPAKDQSINSRISTDAPHSPMVLESAVSPRTAGSVVLSSTQAMAGQPASDPPKPSTSVSVPQSQASASVVSISVAGPEPPPPPSEPSLPACIPGHSPATVGVDSERDGGCHDTRQNSSFLLLTAETTLTPGNTPSPGRIITPGRTPTPGHVLSSGRTLNELIIGRPPILPRNTTLPSAPHSSSAGGNVTSSSVGVQQPSSAFPSSTTSSGWCHSLPASPNSSVDTDKFELGLTRATLLQSTPLRPGARRMTQETSQELTASSSDSA